MRYPLDKPLPKVSSPYGWRIHPITKKRVHHNGVDWVAPVGERAYAIANGTVIYAGASTLKKPDGEPAGGGYIVRVRHRINGEWITATYFHLRKGSIQVKRGQKVAEGDWLANTGNSGDSTGAHLHFEIQRGKVYIYTNNGTRYTEPVSYIKTQIALEKK